MSKSDAELTNNLSALRRDKNRDKKNEAIEALLQSHWEQ